LEHTMWSVVFRLNTQRRLLYAGVFFMFSSIMATMNPL
jgi:hypothetical protein